jgi:hypothetical protein
MRSELIVCLVFFTLQIGLHVASFFRRSELTVMYGVGAVVFALISSAVFARLIPSNPMVMRNLPADPAAQLAAQKVMWRALPAWFRRTAIVTALYFACAFAVAVFAQRHGSPEIRDGGYSAGNRNLGIAFRRIDADEYWRLQGHLVRMMTAFGAMLSWMPIAAIVWHREQLKRGASA